MSAPRAGNPHLEQLRSAVLAAVIHSPHTFSWFGKRPRRLPSSVSRDLTPATARAYLTQALTDHLYSYFYCKGYASPMHWESGLPSSHAFTTPFVEELSRANHGSGYWEDCALDRRPGDSTPTVVKDGVTWSPGPSDILVSGAPEAGSHRARWYIPKEHRGISPGFYLAIGDTPFPLDTGQTVLRLYWNCLPRGALRLMDALTAALSRESVPYQFKVLDDPAAYVRCDSAVLYLPADAYEAVRPLLECIHSDISRQLQTGTPVFTKALAAQVGLAEHPGGGDSFGLNRCGILAGGLMAAWEEGQRSAEAKLEFVVQHFERAGIDVERPYLNPGRRDVYPFQARSSPAPPRGQDHHLPTASDLIDEACCIGRRLLGEALWHGDRCTWIGAAAQEVNNRTTTVLGPDVYTGTAGVALFLAELYRATGEAEFARGAAAAVNQTLSRLEDVATSHRLGLFDGWTGASLCIALIGVILRQDSFVDVGRDVFLQALAASDSADNLDIISGSAGAILAALTLSEILRDESLRRHAELLGDDVLERAIPFEDGLSWNTINRRDEYHLTGFSHGTAGIAFSLLELYSATGDARYRRAAEMGFTAERFWFDPETGNWPDLRETAALRRHPPHARAYSTYWCHGAPGIALSRLRAYQILGNSVYRDEALIALETTRRMVDQSLPTGQMNFSLCHGLAGNAEVLRLAGQMLGPEYTDGPDMALRVAAVGRKRYGSGRAWPLATPAFSPGLMLGLAGIGYAYLCLACAHTSSILLLLRGTAATHEPVAATTPTLSTSSAR